MATEVYFYHLERQSLADTLPKLLERSLGLLGLGRKRVVRVPVDGQGRMRADALPRLQPPAIVCVQAGNVNTGAIDPIGEICDAARTARAWVHVDGAFGLWAAASPQYASVTAGIEKADSWATDAHKWLNVPYDSGLAFVRDPDALRAAMSVSADYLPAGTYVLTYTLVPLQAGEYRVLPAHAWQSFFPEVQGTSAGAVFEIKP